MKAISEYLAEAPSELLLHGVEFPPLQRLLVEVPDAVADRDKNVARIVFLITKNHADRLQVTLPAIAASSDRLYVIDSSTGPETRQLCRALASSHVCYHGLEEQRRTIAQKTSFQQALRSGFITWLSDNCWDIWSKRNYALLYARSCGFSPVLLIDDDIIAPPHLIGEALARTDANRLVGAHVRGMPDVSVVGHLCALHGLTSQSFVSGHFLAVDITAAGCFYFADIYNEDWLFVLLNCFAGKAARCGAIFQLYWNPYFNTEERATSEEFGEIIIEGVARVLLAGEPMERLGELAHWAGTLRSRCRSLSAIAASDLVTRIPSCAGIIQSVRKAASAISGEQCVNFWHTYQKRLPEWRAQLELAGLEGLRG